MRRVLLALGVCLCVGGLVATLTDVAELAREERDYRGPLEAVGGLNGPRATLGQLSLARGQTVHFSVCSTDAFEASGWRTASFAIFHEHPTELVLRVVLDDARLGSLRQGPNGGCVDLAHANELSGEGEFSVVVEGAPLAPTSADSVVAPATQLASARQPVSGLAPPDTLLWTHVTALRPLSGAHMGGPVTAWLGVLLLTLLWLLRPPAPSAFELLAADEPPAAAPPTAAPAADLLPTTTDATTPAAPPPGAPPPRKLGAPAVLGVALVGLVVAFVVSANLPPSPLTPMGAALVLFVGQLVLVAALGGGAQPLGLTAPPRWPWLLLAMPLVGVALRLVLAQVSQLVPSTGVAPIERLVSAPSGMLTMLAIGLVAPFAEELFFRGLLFRQVETLRGPVWAAVVTALLFALLHAPQAFGAWPSLVSIACAGAAFSALRAVTGSTLASALAHLGYNGIIALPFVVSLLTR
jgi:membrane protease YdiL (CAAX protease family)